MKHLLELEIHNPKHNHLLVAIQLSPLHWSIKLYSTTTILEC
ncbi:hypothetical protein Patl1_14027 [Pistacia atlantica]|uniref:Uncharacterized protein n=1 Tax=Pistacia atlantica TaxID=434234 RepID=A0ACC1AUJ3_9ROSI|nr:hypothetical protein Patl1_14027 [Pistacia atlantica]